MNAFSSQSFDHLLAELTQADAILHYLTIFWASPRYSASPRVHPSPTAGQERKVKEIQGMRLNDLTQIHDSAQGYCRGRNSNREDLITGFAGRNQ
jgi:hypothetical protein